MPKFLLMVNHDGGVFEEPMDQWEPGDIAAHFNYYEVLTKELTESGEMVQFMALADPRLTKIVRSDGSAAPLVTDGPFPESKEVLAGFNVFDVESEARALEIAARISAVPGPGGVPTQQPVEVRQVMSDSQGDL
ncbi:YciI family protein [Streptomyces sp. NPDC005134]|uniref:YciI family protein n=1 Tax=unclassified Streptomyces TaxID=2593676 RepID=UPI00224D2EE6|nr:MULTISPECIES: YciI family protein [unclassified Streptomyces]WSF82352.1 YciI family protein [Streptomyces sp. NBC_01744]MCX5317288.1 YciI family protein [Streptomyces sp. NBC_00154]WSC41352.1 YciI family protein [Streptomyces sp. NBC_01763]WSC49741.1 YciI family protein [Streptomyces sp. NBC_01762]WSC51504.1 YciI family protein [Streptomyces sp. NBC_01761]